MEEKIHLLQKKQAPRHSARILPSVKAIAFHLIIMALTLCFMSNWLLFPFIDAEEPLEPLIDPVGEEGSGLFKATWAFDYPDEYNTTNTVIDDNVVTLQTNNLNWTQSSKNDFLKGTYDNITVLQTSEAETVYERDFEDGTKGWQHGGLTGQNDDWEWGPTSAIPDFMQTGAPSSRLWGTVLGANYTESGGQPNDIFLMPPPTNPINLSNSVNTKLSFWHFYDFESDSENNDGGRVEISIDNGMKWVDSGYPGYDEEITDGNNPLNGEFCFTGNSSGWKKEQIDLSDYDGEPDVLIRFHFATNGHVADWGWYIDDIVITSNTLSDGEVELDSETITVGNILQSEFYWNAGETIIDNVTRAAADGFITEWSVYIAQTGTGRMKIFREVNDNFIYIYETELETFSEIGIHTRNCSIEIEEGDYIGWYGETARMQYISGGSAYYKSGNVTEFSTSKSLWTHAEYTISINAKVTARRPIGTLTSEVWDAGSPAKWETISWNGDISNSNTAIVLQTRTGDTEILGSTWSDWSIEYNNPSGSIIRDPNAQYIQFRATLTTAEQPFSPVLNNVTISYMKYLPLGEVETADLSPEIIVQWEQLVKSEDGEDIKYFYSLDSGDNWEEVPPNGDMRGISVLEGKIRFKAVLSTEDTTVTPTLKEMSLQYSSATPKMQIQLEVDKKNVNPGDTVSFEIFYSNVGNGNATNVDIAFFMGANLSYRDDTSQVVPTIEEGNVRKWHFDLVEQTSKSFLIDTKVVDTNVDTEVTLYAMLNYTDIGGNSYPGVISNTVTINIERGLDVLFILSILALVLAVIAVLLYFVIARHRRIAAEKADLTETGIGYLIMEENPKKSYELFKELVDGGQSGLCMTRSFPHRVRKMYGIEDLPILWLSRTKDPSSILPTNLGGMLRHAKVFMEENEDSVILLDGLEYLMVHNDFQRVLKLVHGLNELAAIHAGRLIIPMNPLTMDADKVALLKRDLKELGKMAM